MKKRTTILNLKDTEPDFINDSAVSINVCRVTHTPVHYHSSSVELLYCIDGEFQIHCNHETVSLKKGQMFTIDFEDIHCLYSDCDNLIAMMHINLKKVSVPWSYLQFVYFACEDGNCEPYQLEHLQKIKKLILSATYKYCRNGTLSSRECDTVASNITYTLLNYFDWYNYINVYPNNNDEIRERFQAISAYCQTNFRRKITISELADIVHINENYLSRFIKKSPYGSFSNMLGYIRCFDAQRLLLTTELSVIQISSMCGFSDDKYFYKHFKQAWGQTPSQYRKWFLEYIKSRDSITVLEPGEALDFLEPYTAEYFSELEIQS